MSCRPHKRRCGKQKNTSEQIYRELRQVQNITGCSTKTLDLILSRLHPFLKGCEDVELKMPRVRARKKSQFKQQLHGCAGCDNYVFGPENVETRCPHCGDERYTNGKPKEVGLTVKLFLVLTYLFILLPHTCRFVGSSPCGLNSSI